MKINGVHDSGVKNYHSQDPLNFVFALHGCIQDAFPVNGIPEDILERLKLLKKNADILSKQNFEMLAFLRLYDLKQKIEKPAGNVATEEAPGGVSI